MNIFKELTQVNTHQRLIRQTVAWLLMAFFAFSVLIAIFLYFDIENSLIEENKRLAGQTESRINAINDQIQEVSIQIIQDRTISAYLNERDTYFYGQSVLESQLINYVNSHRQLIRYIGAYNGYLGTYETSIGTLPAGQMGMPVGNSQFSIRPREIKLDDSALAALNEEFARLVVFYARVDDNPQRTNYGLVVIHLDEAIFVDLLKDYQAGIKIYLTDSNGIVYASNQPDAFITDLSYASEFSIIFQNSSGTRDLADEGTIRKGSFLDRKLTYYKRSADSGFYEVMVIDGSIIWLRFASVYIPLLLIGLIMVSLSIYVIARLMTKYYRPIQNLITQVAGDDVPADEYLVLHKALILGDQAGRIAREKYLFDLMLGNPNHEDAERISQILAEFNAPAFLLIVGRFDGFGNLAEMQAGSLDSFRFAIINITQELLAGIGSATGIVTSDNEITLMLQLADPVVPESLEEVLSSAQTQIKRYFSFSVSFAYFKPVIDFDQFNESYQQTTALFSYRLFLGPNSILTQQKTLAISKNVRYPIMAEKRILEALNLRRQDLLLEGIDDFMQVISTGYSQRTTNYFSQLLFSVFKQVDNTVDLVDYDYDNYIETNGRLIRCDQLSEARQIIARFCLELMTISQEKTRSATDLKHERLHEELISYLKDNLEDPSLSLESTAARFNLSTGYLGKLVKASSGNTFSSLLSAIRLEKAADLLLTTNQPAYKIAEMVGIPNVTYFSTLFKRQYGLSPAPYREKRE